MAGIVTLLSPIEELQNQAEGEKCRNAREPSETQVGTGETVVCLSGNNSTDMIDQLGPLGFDAIWLEGEHGPVDYGDIPDLTRACDLWGMTSVVRVNRNNEGIIYRTFDLGAQGIVVPHVNTADEARAVVECGQVSSGRQAGHVHEPPGIRRARTMFTGPTTRRW